MRILILGAGALGGYYGARLLAAGRDVTFLVRPGTAAALAQHGLRVTSEYFGDLALPGPSTYPQGTYDLVLLSAKAFDLDSALDAIAPYVGERTAVLPMLNGMAHMPVLDARFGRARVLGGTCFISATRAADGTILQFGERAMLYFGLRDKSSVMTLDTLERTLAVPGYEAFARTDITHDQWQKWTLIATAAGVTCLYRASIGDVVRAQAAEVILALFDECIAVADAAGFRPAASYIEQHRRYLSSPDTTLKASALRDMQAGAQVESFQLLGDLLERAQGFQVTTPLLKLAYSNLLVYEAERERHPQAIG